MEIPVLNEGQLDRFKLHLIEEERSPNTIEKYSRDVRALLAHFPGEVGFTKEMILDYKQCLLEKYKTTSVNSMLVAINQFFRFCKREDLRVKLVKVQRSTFREHRRELSLVEYKRLVRAAQLKKKERLSLLVQAICSTGIRVSEHRFITVESLRKGVVRIVGKGKERTVFLPDKLRKMLLNYCRRKGISSGPVFVTRYGNPLNRCNIWAEMKALCASAGVESTKCFPHNLRHLFALSYYRLEKDVVRLADILGHASIETTRIYTSTTDTECRRSLERLSLLA